jgi:uncharacterized membrane protein
MVHVIGTSVSLLTGSIQLGRRKGDATHRRIGYTYCCAMAAGNLSALAIYKFTGGFNVFHALALYSLFNVSMALRPMLVRPRPHQWRRIHYQWVSWSYVGLCAAAVTELLLRVFGLPGWLSAGVGTPPVVLSGWLLIKRFAPPLRPPGAAPVA